MSETEQIDAPKYRRHAEQVLAGNPDITTECLARRVIALADALGRVETQDNEIGGLHTLIAWLRSLHSNLNTLGCWHIPITETERARLADALEAAERRIAKLEASKPDPLAAPVWPGKNGEEPGCP